MKKCLLIGCVLILFWSTFNAFAKNTNFYDKKRLNAEVQLTLDDDYLPVLVSDIKSAQKSIQIEMYLIQPNFKKKDDVVKALLDELIAAQKRGVEVDVISDQNIEFWKENKKKVVIKSKEALDYLSQNGISVRLDDKNETTHSKLVVIDGKIVHIGSTNWTYSAFKRNHEANVRLTDRDLAHKLQVVLKQRKTTPYDNH